MSNELTPFQNPGLPEHKHREADHDEKVAKRYERQIALLFTLSAISTVGTIGTYIFMPQDLMIFVPILGNTNAHQLFLGLGLAGSLFFIGMGAIQWARVLMPDTEVIAERHELRSDDKDREDFVKTVKEQAASAGLGRRSLIKRSLAGALGLVGLTPIVLLRDLGPTPGKELEKTSWKKGTRLVTEIGDRPIKPSDMEVGSVVQAMPELEPGKERTLNDVAKDAVLLIRLQIGRAHV